VLFFLKPCFFWGGGWLHIKGQLKLTQAPLISIKFKGNKQIYIEGILSKSFLQQNLAADPHSQNPDLV
jgi:hypothetical protein